MAVIAHALTYRAREVLVHAGQTPPGMFIVAEGQERVFAVGASGKVQVIPWVEPCQTFLSKRRRLGALPPLRAVRRRWMRGFYCFRLNS